MCKITENIPNGARNPAYLPEDFDRPMVFILWGRPAQAKKAMLNNPKHMILEAPHPSPLSAYRGFFGSRPFSKTNDFLREHGLEPIDWQIENIEK